jgi:predicted small lipoprotein YifL
MKKHKLLPLSLALSLNLSFALCLPLALTGCGQKGTLYLPKTQTMKISSKDPATVTTTAISPPQAKANVPKAES